MIHHPEDFCPNCGCLLEDVETGLMWGCIVCKPMDSDEDEEDEPWGLL